MVNRGAGGRCCFFKKCFPQKLSVCVFVCDVCSVEVVPARTPVSTTRWPKILRMERVGLVRVAIRQVLRFAILSILGSRVP